MAWDTSRRRTQLPPNWTTLRQKVKARAGGQCEVTTQGQRCPQRGRDCHHLADSNDHSIDNLQWICVEHHKQETQRQAKQAWRNRYITARKRPPETHPGTL